jgi:hypothetical protein
MILPLTARITEYGTLNKMEYEVRSVRGMKVFLPERRDFRNERRYVFGRSCRRLRFYTMTDVI